MEIFERVLFSRFLTVSAALLGIGLILFGFPWTESFWLDECVSAWVSMDWVEKATQRAANYQAQSPLYYVLLASVREYGEASELHLRLFSLGIFAAFLLSFFAFARLFLPVLHASLAVLFLMNFDSLLVASLSIRPYGLALLFAMLSMLSFEAWMRRGTGVALISGTLSTGLMVAAHYVFFLFLFPQVLLFASLVRKGASLRRAIYASLGAIIASMLVLIAFREQLLMIYIQRELFSFFSQASIHDYGSFLFPLPLIVIVLTSLLATWIFVPKVPEDDVEESDPLKGLLFFFLWWFLPLLGLALAERFLGEAFFFPRYFLWIPIGTSLFLASGIGLLLNRKRMKVFFLLLCIFSGGFGFFRVWQIEDWRGAFDWVGRQEGESRQWYLMSGLIESRDLGRYGEPGFREYLLAPHAVYGEQGSKARIQPIPVPSFPLKRELSLIRSLEMAENGSLVIFLDQRIEDAEQEMQMTEALDRLLEYAGKKRVSLSTFGRVVVYEIGRGDPSHPRASFEGGTGKGDSS